MHFKFPFIYFSILVLFGAAVMVVHIVTRPHLLFISLTFNVGFRAIRFSNGMRPSSSLRRNFEACCKNDCVLGGFYILFWFSWCRFFCSIDNLSKLVYTRYHAFVYVFYSNLSAVVGNAFLLIAYFFLNIKCIQIAVCMCDVMLCYFAGSTNCPYIIWLVLCIYYFLLGQLSPGSNAECFGLCLTSGRRELFSMDVPSDLHANDS